MSRGVNRKTICSSGNLCISAAETFSGFGMLNGLQQPLHLQRQVHGRPRAKHDWQRPRTRIAARPAAATTDLLAVLLESLLVNGRNKGGELTRLGRDESVDWKAECL
eukprot:7391088-Prymnesium_polylepis.2